jgi:hypothetical protein
MCELGEVLEPRGRELGMIEVVPGEVEVPKGGEPENGRIKSKTLQAALTEVKRGHTAVGVAALDALPVAAVRAGPPRVEGARGLVGDGEGALQMEERRGLIRQAMNWQHAADGRVVAVGSSSNGAGELDC